MASSLREKKTQDEASCKSRSRNSMSGVRARQRYTGACRPKLLRFISRRCNKHRKQTRCPKLTFRKRRAAAPQPVLFPEKLNRRGIEVKEPV
jgi:hypothetical protein